MQYYDLTTRIRYAETDQMGVSYYSNHFVWFEMSRTEYFRALGLPYTEYEAQGIFLPVAEAQCKYHKPLRFDDEIVVRVCVSRVRHKSIAFSYQLRKKGEPALIAEGYTVHVFVDKHMKPVRIPQSIKDRVDVYTFQADD